MRGGGEYGMKWGQLDQLSISETSAAMFFASKGIKNVLSFAAMNFCGLTNECSPPPHDKTKYHSCMNATVKQDEKLFDIQNTIDGAYKKKSKRKA